MYVKLSSHDQKWIDRKQPSLIVRVMYYSPICDSSTSSYSYSYAQRMYRYVVVSPVMTSLLIHPIRFCVCECSSLLDSKNTQCLTTPLHYSHSVHTSYTAHFSVSFFFLFFKQPTWKKLSPDIVVITMVQSWNRKSNTTNRFLVVTL